VCRLSDRFSLSGVLIPPRGGILTPSFPAPPPWPLQLWRFLSRPLHLRLIPGSLHFPSGTDYHYYQELPLTIAFVILFISRLSLFFSSGLRPQFFFSQPYPPLPPLATGHWKRTSFLCITFVNVPLWLEITLLLPPLP